MTLRQKTLLVVVTTLAGLMVVLYAGTRSILLDSFAKLEQQGTLENVQRVQDALSDSIAQLDRIAGNWAPWNDTYEFVQGRNESYVESNLTDSTFVNLHLNLMVFVDASGKVLRSEAYDFETKTQVAVPQGLQEHLTPSTAPLLHHADAQSSLSGILMLAGAEHPLLVASRPIAKSDGQGPVQGTLIVGRFLSNAEVEQLARLTRVTLTLYRFNSAPVSLSDKTPAFVQPLSDQIIAGYGMRKDIYGNPALVLKVEMPRDIYHQGQVTLNYLLWSLVVAGLVFIGMTVLLWDQLALSRLARLSASVSRIGASGDLSARVEARGSDELSNVGGAINRMLEALQRSEGALRESEARFRRLAENAQDMIYRFRVEPSPGFDYVSPAATRLTGYTAEEFYADALLRIKLVHPGDKSLFESVAESPSMLTKPLVLRWVRKDGQIIYVEQRNVAVYDQDGKLTAFEGIARDVTERKLAEEALRESEEQFRRRATELQALYETSLRLSAELETSELLHLIVEQAVELVKADTGGLYIHVPQQNQLVLSVALDSFREHAVAQLNPGQDLTGQVFEKRHSMLIKADSGWPEGPDTSASSRSTMLAVPLLGREGVLGVLDIVSSRSLDEHDVKLAELFATQAAVALERARLHTEVQRRALELAALNKAGQAMSSVLDLSVVLQLVIAVTRNLLSAVGVSVLLQDPDTHELVFAAVDSPTAALLTGKRMPHTRGIAGWVMQHKQTALVSDAYSDPRFYRQVDETTGMTTRSLVAAPLMVRGNITGVIEAVNKTSGVFDQHDVEVLEAMASSAAIAAENARLYQMEKEQREFAETLREVGATLASTLNTDTVLDRLLEQVSRVVPNDVADIMLIEGNDARIARWRGYDRHGADASVTDVRFPVKDVSHLRQMAESGEPTVIPDTHTDLNWIIYPGVDWLHSYAGAPICIRDRVIGFLSVNSATPNFFGPQHAQRLRTFANQAAIALENARLFEEERRTADRLQALSRRLVGVQETERSRIARELHDEVSQALTSMMVNLRLLEQEAERPKAVADHVAKLKRMTDTVLENLHRLAADLRPASLDHLGLVAALRQYIQAFGHQHNLDVQFEAVGLEGVRMPTDVETALYRIVQEALTNVARHARAGRVDVVLERRQDQLVVIVEDNGAGFDPNIVSQSDRLGLVGMRERAEMLGGTLVVESEIGTGTTVLVEVPYVHSHPDS